MSMVTRILPASEWGKLANTELGPVVAAGAMPEGTEVVVVEEDGEVVGCWALMRYYHCEGVHIAEKHRGKMAVPRRLWTGMMALARVHGAKALLTGCVSEHVQRLLEHSGAVELPGKTFILPVGD